MHNFGLSNSIKRTFWLVLFGAVGLVFISLIRAVSYTQSFEAESAAPRTSNALIKSDTSASSGQYLQFVAGSQYYTELENNSSLDFINKTRSEAGKPPLKFSSIANGWALNHTIDQAKECRLWHQDLSSFLGKDFGPKTVSAIAENVAYSSSIEKVLNNLKNSSGHYNNMIGDYTHAGIGVVRVEQGSCQGRVYTTQMFMR